MAVLLVSEYHCFAPFTGHVHATRGFRFGLGRQVERLDSGDNVLVIG